MANDIIDEIIAEEGQDFMDIFSSSEYEAINKEILEEWRVKDIKPFIPKKDAIELITASCGSIDDLARWNRDNRKLWGDWNTCARTILFEIYLSNSRKADKYNDVFLKLERLAERKERYKQALREKLEGRFPWRKEVEPLVIAKEEGRKRKLTDDALGSLYKNLKLEGKEFTPAEAQSEKVFDVIRAYRVTYEE